MHASLDLDAYLERIGWGGTVRHDLDTVAGLLAAHMSHVPFENLDVLLGRPIRLDLEGLQRKLVQERRGGYCFEHCTLFAAVLERLGFAPQRHAARVVLFVPASQAPRSHMVLSVALPEGRHVLDPGFGALAARRPLPLHEGEPAGDGDAGHGFARDGRHWVLRARAEGRTIDAWVSPLEEEHAVDFEVGNHYTSTHPASPFVNRLLLRADDGRTRIGVMNREVTLRRGGQVEARQLVDRAELRDLLARHFGFDLPQVERLRVPAIPEWD